MRRQGVEPRSWPYRDQALPMDEQREKVPASPSRPPGSQGLASAIGPFREDVAAYHAGVP